jgi:hypothetical protein
MLQKGRKLKLLERPLDSWVDTTDESKEWIDSNYSILEVDQPKYKTGFHCRPVMPSDVTRITNDELGKLHGEFVLMCEWLDWIVAEADLRSASHESYLGHIKAEIRLKKSGTVADKDSKTLNDKKYIEEELKALTLNAKSKLLRARLRGYERCASALSREMTRRTPEHRS